MSSGQARKRKYSSQSNSVDHTRDHKLFIQAHEADLIHAGPEATQAARALELPSETSTIGDGLIKWTFSDSADGEDMWVDRYDARLLLDALPTTVHTSQLSPPSSPSGWTDLPSDTEDTFFFDTEETEDYRRDKRRRLLTQSHQDRLRAFEQIEGQTEEEEEVWGGSDEEPDDSQKELMKRTASHILSSPNPAQLEMRILANHGADKRFAFLRGRWSKSWESTKMHVRLEQNQEKETAGLGGLAGYGSDDTDSEEQIQATRTAPTDSKEAIKEARRARLKEWTEKRRAAKTDTHELKP